MHSIPIDEEPLPGFPGEPGPETVPMPRPVDVELLGDLRGHVLGGRYVLVELLGSGELGCVYSGRDQVSGQQVAVKVLASPEQREVVGRIADRARRRLGVRHPSVAAVLAEGSIGGLWYAVMEHAAGKNLYHAEGRFEGAGLLALVAQLAEGLATLHALGAPHGAISPHNLVWSDAGVKLVDLDVHLTGETGQEEASAWADVTALARVFHELARVGESEAPWIAAIARVARGDLRPSAAEWVEQLRAAEVEALRPQIVAAATHGEGVIDSAWDSMFEETGATSSGGTPVVDDGLHAIEPPAQLAMVSFEVETTPARKPAQAAAAPPAPARVAAPPALVKADRASASPGEALASAPSESASMREDAPAPVREDAGAGRAVEAQVSAERGEDVPAPHASASVERAEDASDVSAASAGVERAEDAHNNVEERPATLADLVAVARANSGPTALTASSTVPSATGRIDDTWTAEVPAGRSNMRLALGLLVVAVVCALLGWQAFGPAASGPAREDEAETPSEPAVPKVAAAGESRELSSETATLARQAAAGTEANTATPAADEAGTGETAVADGSLPDQLSAADFRKILLRTNRSQRVRTCYERHSGGDVEIVAMVGPSGRVQKLRIGDDPLSECLRKIVLKLEFPPAARQAQHNYVFHRVTASE